MKLLNHLKKFITCIYKGREDYIPDTPMYLKEPDIVLHKKLPLKIGYASHPVTGFVRSYYVRLDGVDYWKARHFIKGEYFTSQIKDPRILNAVTDKCRGCLTKIYQ